MSYSRRQLYAMGETFGDSATRMEAGGRIVYGGGGGGGAPEPTTQITESGPTVTNTSGTSSTKLPGYINANTQDIVAKARAIGDTPYKAYTGQRVAEFTPDMLTAMERMRNQGVAGQTTEASGLASLAGQRASDYGMFNEGVQQYMNPYMQNVVDIERRKAQENADRQSAMLSGQAAKMGAFGGSGSALQQRALTRDTAQQLADLQTQGLDRAYQSAVGQYNTGISNTLAASGQLAGLGRDQFGQETDLIKNLGTSGDIQRQREQALLDVDYGNFAEKRDYAAKQLALQKALSSGLEYDTSTNTSSRSVSQPGKTVTQRVAAGGEIRSYADGGITSLLSDQQIAERKQMPISDLARLALQAQEMENARLRAAQQNMDAQQAQMAQGPTVYDDEMRQIAAIERGIGGLDVPDNLVGDASMAGGGIVAFQNLGAVPAPVPAVNYGLPAISTSLIPKPAQDLMAQQRRLAMEAAEQEKIDAEAYLRGIRDDQKALGDPYAPREERLKAREGKFEGAEVSAAQNAFLRFGLEVIAAKGEKNKAKALANAGIGTLDSYGKEMDKIEQSKAAVEEARSRLDELRYSNQKGDKEAVRNAEKDLNKAKRSATSALGTIFGNDADKIISAYDKKLSRDAQYAAANKPTNERIFVDDFVKMKRDMGDKRPESVLRVEGAKNYPGAAASALRAGTAADIAQSNLRDKARDNVDKSLSNFNDPTAVKLRSLVQQDRRNERQGNPTNLADKYLQEQYTAEEQRLGASSNPDAAPATSAAPAAAPASAPPNIASVDGAPRGATIGAQTSRGWEVKDRSGKVIGYAQP